MRLLNLHVAHDLLKQQGPLTNLRIELRLQLRSRSKPIQQGALIGPLTLNICHT